MKSAAFLGSLALALVAASCSSSTTTSSSSPDAGPAVTTSLTWHHDVRPIVETKCQACHVEGGFAPFSLTSYKNAFEYRAAIGSAVETGLMPPWPPNNEKNSYKHDRSLTADQRTTITTWASGGAPEGDPASYIPPTVAPPEPLRVDKTLSPAGPYTPVTTPDEYRCFVMDWDAPTTKFVTGYRVTPGVVPEVHHAIIFKVATDDLPALQALDDADPALGYECFGGPGINSAGWVGAWAPGSLGLQFPPDTGISIEPGSKIVVQMHYNTANAKPAPDLSKVELQLADSVKTPAVTMKWANPAWVTNRTMNIAAGDPDSVHSFAYAPSSVMNRISGGVLKNNAPFTVWTGALHMHQRGVKGILSVIHAGGGTETVLEIDDWNFHWQGGYELVKPITVQPGDSLSVECHFDNSGRRQPVVGGVPLPVGEANWGESTEDEMCLGIMYATP